MFDDSVIPAGLDSMPPGPVLAAVLASLDRSRLNGHDLVVVLRARSRQLAHDQAELYADMVEVSYCPPGEWGSPVERDQTMGEFAADEIRAALTLTRRSAEGELDLAWRLRERLPQVWEALHVGSIDVRRARTLTYGTDHLPADTARQVTDRLLDQAAHMTTGQLAAALRRVCLETDPAEAVDRYRRAVADRRVTAEPNPDGTAQLWGRNLPPHRVAAIRARIDQLAQALRSSEEGRTLDQLRADVFLDLLEGTRHAGEARRGQVDIRVDLTTLIGLTETPGEIPGWGPVIADLARQVVADSTAAEWRGTVTDPATAQVTWTGPTRRRPTAQQSRQVQALRTTCVFPGCRMPATDCDLDHIVPWALGGPTGVTNLTPLCRHDHRVKHDAGWRLTQQETGRTVWTSRLGHTYTTTQQPP